jgi:hypothetical protein
MKIAQSKTLDEFIKEATLLHGDNYDYSEVNYINAKEKVSIICKKHGAFPQTPDSHLRGSGCPCCTGNHSKMQIEYLKIMELLRNTQIKHAENGGEYKIPNTSYSLDGYDAKNNTVYEFHGDFWHGNPKKYKPDEVNDVSKKNIW